jgi:hypothetical protein
MCLVVVTDRCVGRRREVALVGSRGEVLEGIVVGRVVDLVLAREVGMGVFARRLGCLAGIQPETALEPAPADAGL